MPIIYEKLNSVRHYTHYTHYRMPSLIDLPEADVKMWYKKHLAYKNATEKNRSKALLSFLVYTYRKLGMPLTWAMIEKETINEPMKRCIVLTAVKHWAAKPDYE